MTTTKTSKTANQQAEERCKERQNRGVLFKGRCEAMKYRGGPGGATY